MTGYTGFSGLEEEQSGNYLVLHAEVPDATGVTITAKAKNTVTLDSDGILVLRVTDKSRTISFTASKAGYPSVTKKFTIGGMTLTPAE